MESIIKRLVDNPKVVMNGFMVAVTIFLIALMFPKQANFEFSAQVGEIWSGENVYADKDLFIWKTETEIEADKEVAGRAFRPIFKRVLSIEEYINGWTSLLDEFQPVLSADASQDMRSFLRDLRNKEVIRVSDLTFNGSKYDEIRLLESNLLNVLPKDKYVSNDQVKLRMAPILTVADKTDALDRVSIQLDAASSSQALEQSRSEVKTYKRQILQGDLIAAKGSIITEDSFQSLNALQREGQKSSKEFSLVFIGFILLTCLTLGVYIFYLFFHFPEILKSPRRLGFLMILILTFSFLVFSIEDVENLSSYLIPFCIVPIVVKSFFTDRLALFTHVVIVLIASFLSSLGYEFTFLQILGGIVAVLFIEDTRSWNKFFISILAIVGTYFFGYLGLSLIDYQDSQAVDWSVYRWLGISGVLTLLAYPFIPLLAKLFGFVSAITLAELGDLNRPLLKRLGLEAAGTLQHSLQVANLCEAAAEEVGANALLLKVGALYHDIGKLHNPMIFVENQQGINPHDNLTNFESARAIIDHIPVGVKMAQKASLPEAIIDLIRTHHGTTRVEYFYRNQVNKYPDKEFDESLFCYVGPKPRSREETILMMADSLEAASKSLRNPTGKDIDDLVEKIVGYKIEREQLTNSELSYADMRRCIRVFKSMLRNINHVRVEYPEEVKKPKVLNS